MKKENQIKQDKAKCPVCGISESPWGFEICEICGWQDDGCDANPNEESAANGVPFNQYKRIWEENKEKIRNCDNSKGLLVEKIYAEQGGLGDDGKKYIPRADIKLSLEQQAEFKQRMARIKQTDTVYQKEKREKKALIVRSEFPSVGKYSIPLIQKQNIDPKKIDVMGYVRAKVGDTENTHKTLHFVTHDWNFETVWAKPDASMEKLGQYYALCSPDFSIYWDMPLALQINNTFRNRWCGAYWQSLGAKVIPTIAWGDEKTWEFCFDGVEQGSVVFVATYMTRYPDRWLAGYKKMLEVIKPIAIIVYGDKIPGMNTQNVTFINPYDTKEGVDKLGVNEYAKRFFAGEVYPK